MLKWTIVDKYFMFAVHGKHIIKLTPVNEKQWYAQVNLGTISIHSKIYASKYTAKRACENLAKTL